MGGAAAGFQVGGPMGALIGGGIGLVGSGIKELVDWISREDPEQVKHRNFLKKIDDNTNKIKLGMQTGIFSREVGIMKLKENKAKESIGIDSKNLKQWKKDLADLEMGHKLREYGSAASLATSNQFLNDQGGNIGSMDYEQSKAQYKRSIEGAEKRIADAKKTVKEAPEKERKQIHKEWTGRVTDQLDLQKSQRKLEFIEFQNKRYERQKRLVSGITGDLDSKLKIMLLSNKVDDEGLKNSISKAKVAMEAEKDISKERLARAKGILASSQQDLVGKGSDYAAAKKRTSEETMDKEMKKKLAQIVVNKADLAKDEKHWKDDENTTKLMEETESHRDDLKFIQEYEANVALVKESEIAMVKENANINRLVAEGAILWKKRVDVIETQKTLLAGTASLMETQIGILDQMGMGIGAPAEMRYQLMQQIGMQVLELDKQIAIAKEAQANGDGSYDDIQKEILAKEQERLQLIQKQFSVSKSLREGWVDALSAMTVASGRITKIMINRQSNLATMLSKGGVTSNVSGKLGAGGGRSSERFGMSLAGGLNISGGGNAGYQTDYGPDIRRVREMQGHIRRGNIDRASRIATSQGTIMANKATSGSGTAYLKGPGLPAATQPGAAGTRNIPGRNVGAGGGWSKTDKQGVTVLNLHVEVHNRAEMTKVLNDMINKTGVK